ncbi:hypothetical protein AHAS_Ahas01G0245100 [Arachis hypogaea]
MQLMHLKVEENLWTKVLQIVNSEDVITIQKRVEEAQWVYAEVGKELRLYSRDSSSVAQMFPHVTN